MSIPPVLRAIAFGAALVAGAGWASACGSTSQRPAGVPAGSGWHCFAPHPDGSRAASCARSQATCVRAMADAMEEARRDALVTTFSSCRVSREAWCVALGARDAVCVASQRDCELLRSSLDETRAECVRIE